MCQIKELFMTQIESKKRIEWVDLAKGICIILVVIHHLSSTMGVSDGVSEFCSVFRMPLYFILSGLFFKEYGRAIDFFLRKIDKLIIPYVFFFVTLGVTIPYFLYKYSGFVMAEYAPAPILVSLKNIFTEIGHGCTQIWFLQALFEANMIFYVLKILSKKKESILLPILVCITGVIGLQFAYRGCHIFYYIDTSITAVPFFYFGYYLRNKTNFLNTKIENKKQYIVACAVITIIVLLLIWLPYSHCGMIGNSYGDLLGILLLYPKGILGTMMILIIACTLKKMPIVSYLGRYSIIVLCIHEYVYNIYIYIKQNVCLVKLQS